MSRRTKIVATLGPASQNPDVLRELIVEGVNVARINFSHGSEAQHLHLVQLFRSIADELGKTVAVLGDLPGPKLRVVMPHPLQLDPEQAISFALIGQEASDNELTVTEPEALADVQPGQRILLDDGRLQLVCREVTGSHLVAVVKVGGKLLPNKGLNLPDTDLKIAAVTERDTEALAVAAKADVDWLALSFVRGPEAAEELRTAAQSFGLKVPVLAKLERPEAVRRMDAIIEAFDGVMVARGDLGVEIPLEQVPAVQKQIIKSARAAGKPVITATDMLDSMRSNPRPTRAEASDVANAIYDGTDAVMLSGETAVGEYPIAAVRCMARIAQETEAHMRGLGGFGRPAEHRITECEIDEPVALAASDLAEQLRAAAIVAPSITGRTARMLARRRPWAKIVVPVPNPKVLRQMTLIWGLTAVPMAALEAGEDRMIGAVRDAYRSRAIASGDRVVVVAGHPIEGGGRFPTLRVVQVGEHGECLTP